MIVWATYSRAGLPGMILLACQCVKNLIANSGVYSIESVKSTLTLHIGLSAGEVAGTSRSDVTL